MLIDKNRMNELFDEHYQYIYQYCLSVTSNEQDAEDAAQQAFVILIQKSEKIKDTNLKAWLSTTAYYEACKISQKKNKDFAHVPYKIGDDVLEENLPSPFRMETELDYLLYPDSAIKEQKEKILSELSPKEIHLYKAVFEENKTYKQIADELGTSEKTINVRSFRLKTKLKNILKTVIFLIFMTFYYIFM